MANLDTIEELKKLDPSGVLGSTGKFADQCRQAWAEASVIQFPNTYKEVQNIVVCGMGGSRFTPRTVKELFKDAIRLPYEIIEDYVLPAYVGPSTLVVLSSYSGTTEEVIACGKEAIAKGAKLTGVAMGGAVGEILRAQGVPAYIFNPIHNPCGQPRIGGGYMLMGHLGLLSALGAITVNPSEIESAIAFVEELSKTYTAQVVTDKNEAKKFAMILKDTHPFLITAEFLKGFGNAFANQINETAKMISDYRYISELNHHLIEGLKRPDTLHENGLFVFFESDLYSKPIQKRFGITKTVVAKQNVKTHSVTLQGKSKLAQTLGAYALSGFTTFYMAMLYDTDPIAIPWVDFFKAELAKS